jgi:hypothetical protein
MRSSIHTITNMKYTKNEHMWHLNEGATARDAEARQLISERVAVTNKKTPRNLGQWLQVNHREVFNRDFQLHVDAKGLTKHCMSK